MKVTLKDISKTAGVDVVSVSYTLRNHPRAMELKPETREKIISVAQKLGYRRNELAAAIRTGANRTVAVICRLQKIEKPDYDSVVIAGIMAEATKLDYGIKIYSDIDLKSCFDEILGHQIKYVLSMSIPPGIRAKTAELCRKYNIKLVYVYETSQGEFPAVISDDFEGAFNTVKYLIGLGHHRIALICAPHTIHYQRKHHFAYLKALEASGIKSEKRLTCCKASARDTEQAIEKMLKMPEKDRPTAFYCIGDTWAMLVQRAALRNGLSVPDDISVVGYGNSLLAQFAASPLSSVEQKHSDMGKTALRILLEEKVNIKPTDDNCYLLPTKFILRESVAEPKKNEEGET